MTVQERPALAEGSPLHRDGLHREGLHREGLHEDELQNGESATRVIQPFPAPATATEVVPRSNTRLFFVDHLRVALTMLVIVHHLAVTYGVVAPWYYVELPNNELVTLVLLAFVFFNQAFFMGLFFMLSGYFVPKSYDRKGIGWFIRDRVIRLGIPLLIFALILGPLASIIGYNYFSQTGQTTLTYWEYYPSSINPGPLWFVEVLLLFSLFYALWRWLTRKQRAVTNGARQPLTARAVIVFTLALAVATFIFRIWVPFGTMIPIVALPTPSHLPQYASLFVVGIVAYRNNWFLTLPDKAGRMGFVAALVATLTLFPLAMSDFTTFLGGLQWRAFVYALWEAIFCVGMGIGLLTLFRKRFNRESPVGRFLSTHAYTVYVIHAVVITYLAYALQGLTLFPLLKFVAVSILAIPFCWLVAYLVRKLPLADRVL